MAKNVTGLSTQLVLHSVLCQSKDLLLGPTTIPSYVLRVSVLGLANWLVELVFIHLFIIAAVVATLAALVTVTAAWRLVNHQAGVVISETRMDTKWRSIRTNRAKVARGSGSPLECLLAVKAIFDRVCSLHICRSWERFRIVEVWTRNILLLLLNAFVCAN